MTGDGLVSRETGEIKEPITFIVEKDSRVITRDWINWETARVKQNRLAKEARQRQEASHGKRKEKFVFVDADIDFKGVRPAMITRLIYLSTYAGYKGCRKGESPLIKRGVHLKKNDLAGVLQLSERHAVNFLNEVSPAYIHEDSEGYLYLDGQSFIRGSLKKKNFKQYQQIYNNGVRRLYEASKGKNHKLLGYMFAMIPFINIEHNILCWNPEEKDIAKVNPMTPEEFCTAVGYDQSNIGRLMRIYSSILFDVNGKKEHFCKLICDWNNQSNAKICINPAVIYAGSAYNRVEITRLYFMEKDVNTEMKQ